MTEQIREGLLKIRERYQAALDHKYDYRRLVDEKMDLGLKFFAAHILPAEVANEIHYAKINGPIFVRPPHFKFEKQYDKWCATVPDLWIRPLISYIDDLLKQDQ